MRLNHRQHNAAAIITTVPEPAVAIASAKAAQLPSALAVRRVQKRPEQRRAACVHRNFSGMRGDHCRSSTEEQHRTPAARANEGASIRAIAATLRAGSKRCMRCGKQCIAAARQAG